MLVRETVSDLCGVALVVNQLSEANSQNQQLVFQATALRVTRVYTTSAQIPVPQPKEAPLAWHFSRHAAPPHGEIALNERDS